jgi:hypothetical protein
MPVNVRKKTQAVDPRENLTHCLMSRSLSLRYRAAPVSHGLSALNLASGTLRSVKSPRYTLYEGATSYYWQVDALWRKGTVVSSRSAHMPRTKYCHLYHDPPCCASGRRIILDQTPHMTTYELLLHKRGRFRIGVRYTGLCVLGFTIRNRGATMATLSLANAWECHYSQATSQVCQGWCWYQQNDAANHVYTRKLSNVAVVQSCALGRVVDDARPSSDVMQVRNMQLIKDVSQHGKK